jgi:cardiolipin synthase
MGSITRDHGRATGEDRILTIPNLLSFARLATVPLFVWLFTSGRHEAAVLLYAAAAWTDFFDGYIARRTGSVTELGRLLDPFADRIFIAALAIALVMEDALPAWLAIGIVGRDVLILGLYPFVHRGAVTRIRVNFVGKSATAALLAGLTVLAVGETSVSWAGMVDEVGMALIAVGAVCYWVSGVMYATEAVRLRGGGGSGD